MPSFPTPLDAYPAVAGASLWETLAARATPFNVAATVIFALSIVHTFLAKQFLVLAHHAQDEHDAVEAAAGRPPSPSVRAEILHFLGEIEVVFGLWAVPLVATIAWFHGPGIAQGYVDGTVDFTEAIFIVVIMALASTRPIMVVAEAALGRVAALGGGTPAAWWLPFSGSDRHRLPHHGAAAMTICALLLGASDAGAEPRLAYATLGLLFVNVSIGGTLTHSPRPRPDGGGPLALGHAVHARALRAPGRASIVSPAPSMGWSCARTGRARVRTRRGHRGREHAVGGAGVDRRRAPRLHGFTVAQAHHPTFRRAPCFSSVRQRHLALPEPHRPAAAARGLLLAGLSCTAGSGWWIAPILGAWASARLRRRARTHRRQRQRAHHVSRDLVPGSASACATRCGGAVTGGGLTVIANAPNPAGQAILARHFDDGISPLGLLKGALVPTLIASIAFLFF